jgi:hypothetical protein
MRKLIRFGLYFLFVIWGMQALGVRVPQGIPRFSVNPEITSGDEGLTTLE